PHGFASESGLVSSAFIFRRTRTPKKTAATVSNNVTAMRPASIGEIPGGARSANKSTFILRPNTREAASGLAVNLFRQPLRAELDGGLAVVVGNLVGDAGVDAHHQFILRLGLCERLLGRGDGQLRPLDRAVRVLVPVGDEQWPPGEEPDHARA